ILNVSATSNATASYSAQNVTTIAQQKNWSQIRVKEEIMDESIEPASFSIAQPSVQSEVETTLLNHSNRSSAFQVVSNRSAIQNTEVEQRPSFESNHDQTNNPSVEDSSNVGNATDNRRQQNDLNQLVVKGEPSENNHLINDAFAENS